MADFLSEMLGNRCCQCEYFIIGPILDIMNIVYDENSVIFAGEDPEKHINTGGLYKDYDSHMILMHYRLNFLYAEGIIDKEEYMNRLVTNYKNSLFGYYISPNLAFKINFTNENYDKFKYLLGLEEYLYLAYENNIINLEEFNNELKNYQTLIYNYDYLIFYIDILPFDIDNSDLDKMDLNEDDYINGYYLLNNKVFGKANENYEYDFIFDYSGYPFGLSDDFIWE